MLQREVKLAEWICGRQMELWLISTMFYKCEVLPREIHGVASLSIGLELEVVCGQPKVSWFINRVSSPSCWTDARWTHPKWCYPNLWVYLTFPQFLVSAQLRREVLAAAVISLSPWFEEKKTVITWEGWYNLPKDVYKIRWILAWNSYLLACWWGMTMSLFFRWMQRVFARLSHMPDHQARLGKK